ncbi:hypothetical protein BsWGS_12785 [Bradybaena similaris]
MAKSRWSKEDLESAFEEFLKTSFSSEDDTEKIKQLLKSPAKAKSSSVNSASLWWDKDSVDDGVGKGKGKNFLKTKNSGKSSCQSKPLLESGNKNSTKGKSITSKSLLQNKPDYSPTKSGDRELQKSKRQPASSKTRGSKSKTDTSLSKDSLEDISERSEEHDMRDHRRDKSNKVALNDSSISISASNEGAESSRVNDNAGFDTLDELADKERFFQELENEHDGTVDYGRLNHDLSQTGGTRADNSVLTGPVEYDTTPAKQQSLDDNHLSSQKASMLSRVALLDSMESTFNTTQSPKVANSRDTTQDNLGATLPESLRNPTLSGFLGGTNTSREMEDLQKVLQVADGTSTIYGDDSHRRTGKTSNETTTTEYTKRDDDVSISDILRKMDAIEQREREIESRNQDVQLRSNYTTHRSPRSPGRSHKHFKDDLSRFDSPHTDSTEIYQPITAVSVKQISKMENKAEIKEKTYSVPSSQSDKSRTSKDRFVHVQSSGYGRSVSPARKSQQLKSGKSPPKAIDLKASPDSGRKELSRKEKSSTGLKRMVDKSSADHQKNDSFHQTRSEWTMNSEQGKEQILLEQIKELTDQLSTERALKAKLQEEIIAQENDFKQQLNFQKKQHEEEVYALKQENFVLSAKMKEFGGENKMLNNAAVVRTTDGGEDDLISKLKQEIHEQETLLAGYQAENKRLYEEIKATQRQVKASETSMFKENQRLVTELTNVKQELELKTTELQNKGIITSMTVQQQIAAGNAEAAIASNRIAHLEGELAEAKRVQENQSRELTLMQQNKFELERHIETLIKEKDTLVRQLADCLKPEQVKELEAKHSEELGKLQKKIKWYAENQELLDKSSVKLRAKDDEIHKLKMRLEDFKSEAGMKLEENKLRAKEKAADAKKIQDLERQVKELEQIIYRRHPNSLPAMMMLAASIPDPAISESQSRGRTVQVLEAQVKKLEKELESKDELSRQDLRAIEQKYNQVKLQFEERIADLERQLSLYQQLGQDVIFKEHPFSHAQALEKELNSVRDRCKKQVSEMQAEVERVTAELKKVKKNQENIMRNEGSQTEAEWKQRILNLQNELKNRNHDIEMLQRTIERMRAKANKRENASKNSSVTFERTPISHIPSSSRDYQPGVFADGDMSALILENQQLKAKVDHLQLELDQQRVDLRRALAETESVARQSREQLENQIEVLRSSHQKEVQRLLTDQALHSSSSRVAELQSKCDTQEVMIRHLQAQLKKSMSEVEQLSLVKAKEPQLQKQVDELQEKLREAKRVQAPGMRHFESLEEKLTDLVQRQRQRETELDLVVKQNHQMSRAEVDEEVEKWKRVVDAKNQELQVFRAELDSILEVLRTLQRQGVSLPFGTLYS